jgi:hypothetical protein
LETTLSINLEIRVEFVFLLRCRQTTPILFFKGDSDLPMHVLKGFFDTFPTEACSQERMPLDDSIPGLLEERDF